MSDRPARIVVADDHTMLREGLRRSLAGQGYDVVAEAANGEEAVSLATQLLPDIVLMDVTMPVLDGLGATRRIRAECGQVRVIVLTMHADPKLVGEAAEAGAHGYLVKDCTTQDIVDAISAAMADERTFPVAAANDAGEQRRVITQRETEVLQLIADGMTTSEAAAALFLSAKTVKNHLASAYGKLEAHDRTQAVLRAARLGLITLSESK